MNKLSEVRPYLLTFWSSKLNKWRPMPQFTWDLRSCPEFCLKLAYNSPLVACCCVLLSWLPKVWNRSNFWASDSQHFFFVPWPPKRGATTVASVCNTLPTLLGPHKCITHGLHSLIGGILPTMHCRSNIVGSCCIRSHTTANTDATTPNTVGFARCFMDTRLIRTTINADNGLILVSCLAQSTDHVKLT